MALSLKRAAFVREYTVDLNATKAAERAGYSPKTAYSQGHRLLKDAEIQRAIADAQANLAQVALVTAEDVIRGLLAIAEGGNSEPARVSAWAHLGKHLGMFAERTEHSGGLEIRIIRE